MQIWLFHVNLHLVIWHNQYCLVINLHSWACCLVQHDCHMIQLACLLIFIHCFFVQFLIKFRCLYKIVKTIDASACVEGTAISTANVQNLKYLFNALIIKFRNVRKKENVKDLSKKVIHMILYLILLDITANTTNNKNSSYYRLLYIY